MGGASSSQEASGTPPPRVQGRVNQAAAEPNRWTADAASKLQEAVDRIFSDANILYNLEFSFNIADPLLEGCPLIGCSTGFTKLCGYELEEIVGRNCRFLVDAVPADLIDSRMRRHVKDFCEAVKLGIDYRRPQSELEAWMPQGRPADELLAMQTNARKNGTLFNNMFYMKVFDLSSELGKERPYIVALQSELTAGRSDLAKLSTHIEELDANMAKVKRELASSFFTQTAISRQFHPTQAAPQAAEQDPPKHLASAFPSTEVQTWDKGRFKQVKRVADATRNGGVVWLMQDHQADQQVAVKQMPNSWMQESHDDFIRVHPRESEMPWQDIGCTRFLNSVAYKYACHLTGVFRSDDHTFVVTSFASEGDLFSAAEAGDPPGPKREEAFLPLVTELFTALRQLHDMQIVHRDISLENVLRTSPGSDSSIKLIDFGMASSGRTFRSCPRGKASYEAPEMQSDGDYDAFLSDSFAAGVAVYSMLLKDYPWQSTKPGRCKCFDYVKKEGFRAYCARRCVRGSKKRISDCMSEPLMQLLEGMLSIDPSQRLTLGEKQWTDRRSVWDEPWMKGQR